MGGFGSYLASEQWICRLLWIHCSTAWSRSVPKRKGWPLIVRLRNLSRQRPCRRCMTPSYPLKREGLAVSHKGTYRVHARLGLQVLKRAKRLWRPRVPMSEPTKSNECWPIDFLVRPAGNRLGPRSQTGVLLGQDRQDPGATPATVVCGNRPESASKAMRFWGERSGAILNFIAA